MSRTGLQALDKWPKNYAHQRKNKNTDQNDTLYEQTPMTAKKILSKKGQLRGWLHETGTITSDRSLYKSLFLFTWDRFEISPQTGLIHSMSWTDTNESDRFEVRLVRQFFPCNCKLISDRSEIFVLSMRTKGVELSYRSEFIPVSCNHLLLSYRSQDSCNDSVPV